MKTIKIIFALLVFTFALTIQDAQAQRPAGNTEACNCSDSNKRQIQATVLKMLPSQYHRYVDFNLLFEKGSVEFNPMATAGTVDISSGSDGTAGKEEPKCESQDGYGVDENGNPNKCTTKVCTYESTGGVTVSSKCITMKIPTGRN